ncbi:hypothetical protein G8S49_01540 [Clostridium botulinum C]|jgi:hypothetical protein|uniref:DUF2577 domain-containing protein n=3 Tax=Clostridium TaxID=1485 RepID=A0A9Q4TGW1_CLOBO|nr:MULTISPECIES: hypothetical protein [Clostridium]EGO87215.1 hypothetical protein CBCST_13372 [Clostridium botulinum C str. Stockholm]KEI16831.1 hypothetical protein Z959_08280 [Clostridium novyi B str. ATCC 27606]MCD3194258.1 hypothetical protein [Clostridium botulinum C]MCD3199113.1 hypothetical protein [Clostridium botulinum C]MCD3204588.1 hypothetical protein [Clostridium botulinum C]
MKDPYVELIKLIKDRGADNNPPSIQLGTMVTSTIVKVGDLQIDGDSLFIDEYWKGKLNKGDIVALLAMEDRQTYIILSKVVRM